MNKKHLIFIQSLVDEREEFEEIVYSNVYFKMLYYFAISLGTFFYFVILFGKLSENINIFNLIKKYSFNSFIGKLPLIDKFNDSIPRGIFVIIEIVLLYFVSTVIHKWKTNKKETSIVCAISAVILSIIFILLVVVVEDWIHWILLLGILFVIIIYRFLIINNLNGQISKINNNSKEQIKKIGYLKSNDEFGITLFKGNLRDKTREIFIEKVKNSYSNVKEENYKELKDDIKKIYNEQKLEKIVKKFSILISLISIIGKFLYDYLNKEEVKNKLLNQLSWENIKNKLNTSTITNIICFLAIFFIVSYFIYKIFELRFRDKRERINEVAECIEILHNDNNH